MVDFGYDVSDYCAIDPMFGTLSDFDELIYEIHKRGIKIITDIVPNHTSDQHPWYQASRRNDPFYKDFYLWHKGKHGPDGKLTRPSNWIGKLGGSAWSWDEVRKEYYCHIFLKQQPDLNWRNKHVRKGFLDIMRFWMDRGVDGFRIDAPWCIIKDEDLTKDDPRSYWPKQSHDDYEYLIHEHTAFQPEVHDVIAEWRELLDTYTKKTGEYKLLFLEGTEIYLEPIDKMMAYYTAGTDMVFNFSTVIMNSTSNGRTVQRLVHRWLSNLPEGYWPNWSMGNHDNHRIATRWGEHKANIVNMLNLLLPGTPTTFYGEELGMKNIHRTFDEALDPYGTKYGEERCMEFLRDGERSPMQWSNEKNAGFTTDTPWLPLHPDYTKINVEEQMKDNGVQTPLRFYKACSLLRDIPTFEYGAFVECVVSENIFSWVRELKGHPSYLISGNYGDLTSVDNYDIETNGFLPMNGIVEMYTGNNGQEHRVGDVIDLRNIKLCPGDGIVLQLIETKK